MMIPLKVRFLNALGGIASMAPGAAHLTPRGVRLARLFGWYPQKIQWEAKFRADAGDA